MSGKGIGLVLAILFLIIFPSMVLSEMVSTSNTSSSSSGSGCVATQASTATLPSIADEPVMAIVQTAGNNREVAAIAIGAYLESGWNPGAISGDGGYGFLQVQRPGVVHPDITIEQALDPLESVRYMLPEYRSALEKVDSSLWATNPEFAAATTAYKAERPRYTYYVGQSPAKVRQAWQATLAKMTELGVSTDFGSGSSVVICSSSTTSEVVTGEWRLPIDSGSYTITSRYGEVSAVRRGIAHDGIDLAARPGTPIHAALGGTVTVAGGTSSENWRNIRLGYRGLYVVIDHGTIDGKHVVTRYHHMNSIAVRAGDIVQAGDVIGGVGNTGNSVGRNGGYHVHTAIEFNGETVNPESIFAEFR